MEIDRSIFRSYDIRGLVDQQLNDDSMRLLGRAIGTAALAKAQRSIAVAGDGRLSTPSLKSSLIAGLTACGIDVLDMGQVPTPVLYFATHHLATTSGIMVTGSHNPPEYNGLKIVIAQEALAENDIISLYEDIQHNRLGAKNQRGTQEKISIIESYISCIQANIRLQQPLKIVIDCGNGIAGAVAPELFIALGCQVIPLYCEVDGRFPNHHPDPAVPANLKDLSAAVQKHNADVGLAFDGDGDRLGVVSNSGRIIAADRLLMLFSQRILKKHHKAKIIYDVKCSGQLGKVIERAGGKPLIWRTGHSRIKAKMRQTGALFGGEYSGHIFFADRWYGFDDALYSGARLLEIAAGEKASIDALFADIPEEIGTSEIKIETTEEAKFGIIEALQSGDFWGDGTANRIDGIRVEYAEGWGLLRASNTSPALTLRFEAQNKAALKRIRDRFAKALQQVAPDLSIPDDL